MTGGGSGGHITPILSLARELKLQDPDCELIYIGQKGDDIDSFGTSAHSFDFTAFITAGKFRRYPSRGFASRIVDFRTLALNIRDFFRVFKSIAQSWRILSKIKPDVLFVKGGYVGVPVGIVARLKGIPIITHDSDIVGGLANRIVGRWAVVHATGMPSKYYNFAHGSVRYVGIPLDPNVQPVSQADQEKYKRQLGLPKDSFVLLVTGGSQGARNINSKLTQVAPQLLQSNLALNIIHITGEKNYQEVKDAYLKVLPDLAKGRVVLSAHANDFYKYVGAADLIVGRAGATSIAEYALSRKACIIIPSPYLAAGHQLKNADMLQSNDAAVIVAEQDPAGELYKTISELATDEPRRIELANNIHKLARPDAAKQLAKIILETSQK